MLLEIIQHSTGLIFFSLVYSLKWLSSEVHLPILLISRREYRSTDDCLCNEFSKDLYKNKCTKMKCWRNVADKYDMSPEDAEKRRGHSPFFFQRSYGKRFIVEIVRDRQDR